MRSPAFRVVLGLILICVVVWLGFKTDSTHPAPLMVVLFGVASALIAPAAIALLGSVQNARQTKALEQLVKAGQVQERVAQAETAGQKLRALEDEHARLAEIVRYAATGQMLRTRHEMLEDEGCRLIEQARRVPSELHEIEVERRLLGERLEDTSFKKDLLALGDRLHRSRTGEGRRSVRWLKYLDMPFLPAPPNQIADDLLDGLDYVKTWRLGKRARTLEADKSSADQQDPSQESAATK